MLEFADLDQLALNSNLFYLGEFGLALRKFRLNFSVLRFKHVNLRF